MAVTKLLDCVTGSSKSQSPINVTVSLEDHTWGPQPSTLRHLGIRTVPLSGPPLWQTSGSVWKWEHLAIPVEPWLPEKLGQSWKGGPYHMALWTLGSPVPPSPSLHHAPTLIFTSFGASFFTSLSSLSPKPEWARKNLKSILWASGPAGSGNFRGKGPRAKTNL